MRVSAGFSDTVHLTRTTLVEAGYHIESESGLADRHIFYAVWPASYESWGHYARVSLETEAIDRTLVYVSTGRRLLTNITDPAPQMEYDIGRRIQVEAWQRNEPVQPAVLGHAATE